MTSMILCGASYQPNRNPGAMILANEPLETTLPIQINTKILDDMKNVMTS